MTVEKWVEIETEILGFPPNLQDCPIPILAEANITAYQIYNIAKTQLLVTGMGDVIGVDINTILGLLTLYEELLTEDKTETFEKILNASNIYIAHLNKLNKSSKDRK